MALKTSIRRSIFALGHNECEEVHPDVVTIVRTSVRGTDKHCSSIHQTYWSVEGKILVKETPAFLG